MLQTEFIYSGSGSSEICKRKAGNRNGTSERNKVQIFSRKSAVFKKSLSILWVGDVVKFKSACPRPRWGQALLNFTTSPACTYAVGIIALNSRAISESSFPAFSNVLTFKDIVTTVSLPYGGFTAYSSKSSTTVLSTSSSE